MPDPASATERYPAMCRDGHAEVRYGYDQEGLQLRDGETCPVCLALAFGEQKAAQVHAAGVAEGIERAAKAVEEMSLIEVPMIAGPQWVQDEAVRRIRALGRDQEGTNADRAL